MSRHAVTIDANMLWELRLTCSCGWTRDLWTGVVDFDELRREVERHRAAAEREAERQKGGGR